MATKLVNILHCYAMGIKGISATFGLSRNTVCIYVLLFQESGMPMERLPAMSASRIQDMFGGSSERERTPSQSQLEIEALLPKYAARLNCKESRRELFEDVEKDYLGALPPCGIR